LRGRDIPTTSAEEEPALQTNEPPVATIQTTPSGELRADLSEAVDRPARRLWFPVLLLIVFASAIALLRLRTFHEPLDRDNVTYIFVGDAIVHGGQSYADAYEIKPPGVYVTYALAELIAGFGERQMYLLNIAAAVTTLFGVYWAGTARGRNAGIWAALFWVLLSGAPTVEANQPNTESFINACIVWALALLAHAGGSTEMNAVAPRGRGLMRAIAVGVLFAVATTFKQIAIVDAGMLSLAHLMTARQLSGGRRRALRDIAIFAAVGAVCWVSMIGYYAATGRFDLFWITNFRNAQAYAGNPLFNIFRYVRSAFFMPDFLWFAAPVMALIVLGCVRDRRELLRRPWALYLACLLAIQIKIPLNGSMFLPHYYQYWLPMLAIGAGWSAGVKVQSPGFYRVGMTAVSIAVLAIVAVEQGRYLLRSPDDYSRLKYGSQMVDARELGLAIGKVLRPDESLYQHGNRPELYFYSQHHPPSAVLWTWHLSDALPIAGILLERHLAALDRRPPDLVVVDQDAKIQATSDEQSAKRHGFIWRLLIGQEKRDEGRNAEKALQALMPNYRRVEIDAPGRFPGFEFYVRRGTPLDKRLGAAG
jgi:4-amino-4-deoxy-L-arabinose transferase-like glycosyltransferase